MKKESEGSEDNQNAISILTSSNNVPNKKLIAVLGIIVVLVIGVLLIKLWQYNRNILEPDNNTLATILPTPTTSTSPAQQNNSTLQGSIQSIDETWNLYTNNDLGFSMKVPKQFSYNYGACKPADPYSREPLTISQSLVPLTIVEQVSYIFLAPEYFYYNERNGLCSKVEDVSDFFPSYPGSMFSVPFNNFVWGIESFSSASEKDLSDIIKQNYGQGCSVGTMSPSKQPGTFFVFVKTDGLDLNHTKCPFVNGNSTIELLYSPSKKKAIYIHNEDGLGCNYTKNTTMQTGGMLQSDSDCFDDEMIDSIRLL